MGERPALSAYRQRQAEAAALAWVRACLEDPKLDPITLPIHDERRTALRLATDAYVAWAMEFNALEPARWVAPLTVWKENEYFPVEDWAAPLAINAAMRVLRRLRNTPSSAPVTNGANEVEVLRARVVRLSKALAALMGSEGGEPREDGDEPGNAAEWAEAEAAIREATGKNWPEVA